MKMMFHFRLLSALIVPTIFVGVAEAQSKSSADAKPVEQIRPFRSDADLTSYIRNMIDRRQQRLVAKENRERPRYPCVT